jgi:carbamoyl-phosphate synthase large subunit
MVNCNPETVSTDYDTSDRLYFEPLGAEEVLAVCEREQPEASSSSSGARPAEARPRDRGRRVPDPRHAVLRDRPRRGPRAFGEVLDGLGIRCPEWGIAESGREAAEIAHRIGYPVLVRPSYVLGGRAMRVCYRGNEVVDAFHKDLRGKVLVDRFVENAVEIDVDALCDGEETYIAAVMQHVEEAGVHSGDSACVLPAPR